MSLRPALRAYLAEVRAAAGQLAERGVPAGDAVRSLGVDLLRARGVTAPASLAGAPPALLPLPAADLRTPWVLGQVHEALLDPSVRKGAGAHYTPPAVARGLVALARERLPVAAPLVCDPAVGGGAFLLAAAESLVASGVTPADAVRVHCFGCDLDPVAVDVARATLALFAGQWPGELDDHVVVADGLSAVAPWSTRFDLVVGNPPFQSQLVRGTARDRARAGELKASFGTAARGYVDTAPLFLLRGLDLVREGGRVALVQPQSTLVARDAAAVRTAVEQRARVHSLWFATERVFDAGVRVWAPVLVAGPGNGTAAAVQRRTGVDFAPAPPCPLPEPGAWGGLVADLAGVPSPRLRTRGAVGDVATATAGFRDQFYGLVGHVREARGAAGAPRLVTAGGIDVLEHRWGSAEARFAGATWRRPVVDVDSLAPELARWVRAQLVPKLVVATQTKVLEVAVDEDGDVVPSTPVIAVHAPAEWLWPLAAALSAPPVTAVALQRGFGAALSVHAVKLSARQVLSLPLPDDHGAWEEAARCAQKVPGTAGEARISALRDYAVAATQAYGVEPGDLVEWWLARIVGGRQADLARKSGARVAP
jgi:predicted RNA methylase